MNLDEFIKKVENPTLWDRITTPYFRIKRFLENLYWNLHLSKLKDLIWIFKLWWNYSNMTTYPSFIFMEWQIKQVLKISENNPYYTDQGKHNKQMKIFLECLRRFNEEDYGDINEIGCKAYIRKQNENYDMLLKYMRTMDRWGV